MALVKLPSGKEQVINFSVDIQKSDHITIKLGGLENFVRKKLYAFLAAELSFFGLVTSGSANHIRKLKINKGKPKEKWEFAPGQLWEGRTKQIVEIVVMEWKIEQAE